MSKKIKHLIVDTTAFIKAENLLNIAENVYTVQEVIEEITNDRQRRKLVVLPYDINVKDVFIENIKFVTEFSKKTGDYTSLSATDIKVIALTYQIEKEKLGTEHLKSEPTTQKTIKVGGLSDFNLHPESSDKNDNTEQQRESSNLTNDSNEETNSKSNESCEINVVNEKVNEEDTKLKQDIDFNKNDEDGNDDNITKEDIIKQIKKIDLKDNNELDNVMEKISDNDVEETESDEDLDSDEEEWITPTNLAQKKKDLEMGKFEDKNVEVACITSDFAMQNVLKQIGLNVTAIDGRIIRQLRTFIFRCTTCFKTTSVMTKLFCPKCGHATLKKVSVSIDDEGNQHMYINGRKPLTARGKRFSLPTPRGGQHFQYPILTEDQHIHKRFATKIARKKTNAMDPDYIAGFSPFAMKDVNSKSAVLGIRADKQDVKYWMKNYTKGKK